MFYLRQATASQVVVLSTFLDTSDPLLGTTSDALTINAADIRINKAGAGEVAKNSGGATFDANGKYLATFDAVDSSAVGSITVSVLVPGATLVERRGVVLTAELYDSLIVGTDNLEVDLVEMLGSAVAANLPSTQGSVDDIATGVTVTDVDAATANKIADHILRRSLALARASSDGDTAAFRSLLGGLSKLVNRVNVTAGSMITYEENDSTPFGTQGVTTDVNAEPITQLDTV